MDTGLACDYSDQVKYEALEFLARIGMKLDVDVITLNRDEKTMTRQEIAYRERMLKLLEETPPSFNFTSHTSVEEGIIDYCKTHEVGMIAILPKTYNYIERLFHESFTTKMLFTVYFHCLYSNNPIYMS